MAVLLLATASAAVGQDSSDQVLDLRPGITPPKIIHRVEPEYTQAALIAGIQGTVLISIVVNKQGLAQDLKVLSPLGFGLDEAAMRSIASWRFKPATKDAKPVNTRATVDVTFHTGAQGFDYKAEERRTKFNSLVSRLPQQTKGLPSSKDIQAFQDLARQKLPAAVYVIGRWEFKGEVLP